MTAWGITVRGGNVVGNNGTGSLTVSLPVGSVVGDFAILYATGQFTATMNPPPGALRVRGIGF